MVIQHTPEFLKVLFFWTGFVFWYAILICTLLLVIAIAYRYHEDMKDQRRSQRKG